MSRKYVDMLKRKKERIDYTKGIKQKYSQEVINKIVKDMYINNKYNPIKLYQNKKNNYSYCYKGEYSNIINRISLEMLKNSILLLTNYNAFIIDYFEKYIVDIYNLKYLFMNAHKFCCDSDDICQSYEFKHYRIRIFFRLFNIYLKLPKELKNNFIIHIFPDFININWTTMSRLYNPDCTEFVTLFNNYINHDFANEYNPYYIQNE